MFHSEKNSSKLCTEGAIGNLMNVLNCPQNEVKQFWDIVHLPVHLILQTLGESSVPPKAVLKSGRECDSIQKSLWILCKKFRFSTTSLFQIKCFKKEKLFIYLALAKPALPGQFVLFVSS
jgi:hypothetical protein